MIDKQFNAYVRQIHKRLESIKHASLGINIPFRKN